MLDDLIKNLPRKPGVYIMRDKDDTVIYVGKAKILKNRVSQYFQSGKNHTPKVAAMVENVDHFEYIVTDSEMEALVLECNLIKHHMPKYNILLKDGKGYPYIKITLNEEYPRVELARSIEKDGAKYFGPYLSAATVRDTLELIKKLFAVRSCKRVLPRDIGKGRACLNYQMKQCSAPCQGYISKEEYRNSFSDIIDFLNGKNDNMLADIEKRMLKASESLEFERAAKLRDRLLLLKQISEKQKIISTDANNKDVLMLGKNGSDVCLQIFFVRDGKIIGRESYMLNVDADTNDSEIMSDFIKQYYSMSTFIPTSIVLGIEPDDCDLLEQWLSEIAGSRIRIVVPKRGKNLELVKMVKQNIVETLQLEQLKRDKKNRKMNDLLFELKDILGLDKAPARIEAYDISNTAGTNNVGVCVVFENTVPKKQAYKKFNIRSVEGADDYESMREVLYRRLFNAKEGEKGFLPMPDLILIDGGAGHVNAVKPILEILEIDIPVFGMVKDDRHRTRALTTGDQEVSLNRFSQVFHFITEVQDEVHRFAISFHRAKRKKTMIGSELEKIKGVGPAKRKLLLKEFGSVKKIKTATLDELVAKGIDKKTAENVYNYFNRGEM